MENKESSLTRSQLISLKEMASDIENVRERNFDKFQYLKIEIDRLGRWYKWTSEEKNLVLSLKLQGLLISEINEFNIFNDWSANAQKLTASFYEKHSKEIGSHGKRKLEKMKRCLFCGRPGHLVKSCQILQRIKMKKKSRQLNVVEVNEIRGISLGNVPIQSYKNVPTQSFRNVPIQAVKHVPIQTDKNVPIQIEKKVPTSKSIEKKIPIPTLKNVSIQTEKKIPILKTSNSTQTNIEILKKIFSDNQNAVKDAKINYSSGVKQNHQTTKKKKNLFDCHPYTIFGNFASNIKSSLRKYDDKKYNTISPSREMDEWFDHFFTKLRIDTFDFDNDHKPDLNQISGMIHFPGYTGVYQQYQILKNLIFNEHEKNINQRYRLIANYSPGEIKRSREYQNTFMSMLSSALSNYMSYFDKLIK